MKKLFISVYALLFTLVNPLHAQTFTDSNLPIVILNTDEGVEIPDDPKVLGNMKIIYNGVGVRNYVTDQYTEESLDYDGRIAIEIRGSSSQVLAKKQYGFSTKKADNTSNNNVELLGMPKENDWVLNGLAFDASLVRDYISYTLSRSIGDYAPRTNYCEVIINGDYKGLYVLQEKIKDDENRVNVEEISAEDNSFPEITGGYITKADKTNADDPMAWTMPSYIEKNADYVHSLPDPFEVTPQQNAYIQGEFERLAAQASNISLVDGYPSVIDIPSFVDFMILNELAANVDGYQYSTYFHKDRGGKLRAGPLWDFNLTYGNDLFFWGLDRSHTDTWQFDNGDNIGSKFWKDLFDNTEFKCYLSKRWHELTQSGQPLNLTSLETFIDETVAIISEAIPREKERWDTIDDHAVEITNIKDWLETRITWINDHIGSSAACSNVETPPLVITKIMYNPDETEDFPESDDQEFIEIKNKGEAAVNITGIYFSGMGFNYQFPPNLLLPAQGVLYLAGNAETFQQKYGIEAFGEFTRNLSNSTQKLIVADGFGNVMDEVEYIDKSPWPGADGNGYYLKLTDVDTDNAVATNWIASDEVLSTPAVLEPVPEPEPELPLKTDENIEAQFYPNPVDNIVTIKATNLIKRIQLFDLQGRLLQTHDVRDYSYQMNMSSYFTGAYLVTVYTSKGPMVRKVFKK